MPEKDRRGWRRIPGASWDKLWQIPALFDIKLLSVLAAITGVDCVHLLSKTTKLILLDSLLQESYGR